MHGLSSDQSSRVERRLSQLTVAEKCQLLGGDTNWRTHAIERLEIPAVVVTDGPNGARGESDGPDMTPAVVTPVGISQGATWDPDLVGQLGDLLGREAVRRGCHVLLAPAVNLHRTPIGGRTFEYFSEDPELSAALAVAVVRGVQAHDVAVTVKHFAVNDTEVDRHTVDVEVDDRTLRELYLRPFEDAVVEADAWGVMSAYNQYRGEFCAASDVLLNQILRHEWGFDGVVVSDWFGAHDGVASANGGLSIEMPGPTRIYGEKLAAAVAEGLVDESVVDRLARDVLVLIERTKADERPADTPERSVDDADERALCRKAAGAGTVLLKNGGALPIVDGSVAVIGQNADVTRIMGGGSSALRALPHLSILDAIRSRFGSCEYARGCDIDKHAPLPRPDRLVGPDGQPGLRLQFFNDDAPGVVVHETRSRESLLRFFGTMPAGVGPGPATLRVEGSYIPDRDGPHEFGAVVTSGSAIRVGDVDVIAEGDEIPLGDSFYGLGSVEVIRSVDAVADQSLEIDISVKLEHAFGATRLGVRPPVVGDPFEEAVALAASVDTPIVVVGTTDEWETEGHDRDTIALPGNQDELVRRVAAVNPGTVVVINAGSPVAMPWVDDVNAIVVPFFGGFEMGNAVADVLSGDVDPGGRLPITFPKRLEDSPAWPHYAPVEGTQTYGEGLLMGYRGHDADGEAPLFPFGHGLSYGDIEWDEASISATSIDSGGSVTVEVPLRNVGSRSGTAVVQGYLSAIDPAVARPPKELRAWHKLSLDPGAHATASLTISPRELRRWDTERGEWTIDPGEYDVVIAASATDVRQRLRFSVK